MMITALKTIATAVGLVVAIEIGLIATVVLGWLIVQFWQAVKKRG